MSSSPLSSAPSIATIVGVSISSTCAFIAFIIAIAAATSLIKYIDITSDHTGHNHRRNNTAIINDTHLNIKTKVTLSNVPSSASIMPIIVADDDDDNHPRASNAIMKQSYTKLQPMASTSQLPHGNLDNTFYQPIARTVSPSPDDSTLPSSSPAPLSSTCRTVTPSPFSMPSSSPPPSLPVRRVPRNMIALILRATWLSCSVMSMFGSLGDALLTVGMWSDPTYAMSANSGWIAPTALASASDVAIANDAYNRYMHSRMDSSSTYYGLSSFSFASQPNLCDILSKFAVLSYLATKLSSFVFFFFRQRSVRPLTNWSKVEYFVFGLTMFIIPFSVFATIYTYSTPYILDGTCDVGVPVPFVATELTVDIILSTCYLYLFLRPLLDAMDSSKLLATTMGAEIGRQIMAKRVISRTAKNDVLLAPSTVPIVVAPSARSRTCSAQFITPPSLASTAVDAKSAPRTLIVGQHLASPSIATDVRCRGSASTPFAHNDIDEDKIDDADDGDAPTVALIPAPSAPRRHLRKSSTIGGGGMEMARMLPSSDHKSLSSASAGAPPMMIVVVDAPSPHHAAQGQIAHAAEQTGEAYGAKGRSTGRDRLLNINAPRFRSSSASASPSAPSAADSSLLPPASPMFASSTSSSAAFRDSQFTGIIRLNVQAYVITLCTTLPLLILLIIAQLLGQPTLLKMMPALSNIDTAVTSAVLFSLMRNTSAKLHAAAAKVGQDATVADHTLVAPSSSATTPTRTIRSARVTMTGDNFNLSSQQRRLSDQPAAALNVTDAGSRPTTFSKRLNAPIPTLLVMPISPSHAGSNLSAHPLPSIHHISPTRSMIVRSGAPNHTRRVDRADSHHSTLDIHRDESGLASPHLSRARTPRNKSPGNARFNLRIAIGELETIQPDAYGLADAGAQERRIDINDEKEPIDDGLTSSSEDHNRTSTMTLIHRPSSSLTSDAAALTPNDHNDIYMNTDAVDVPTIKSPSRVSSSPHDNASSFLVSPSSSSSFSQHSHLLVSPPRGVHRDSSLMSSPRHQLHHHHHHHQHNHHHSSMLATTATMMHHNSTDAIDATSTRRSTMPSQTMKTRAR